MSYNFIISNFLNHQDRNSISMRSLSDDETILFKVPSQFKGLVQVQDCQYLCSDKSMSVVLVRTIKNARDLWEKKMIKGDPSLGETPEKLIVLRQIVSPIDQFDSGICFLVQPGEKPGSLQSRIVCRSDDYPGLKRLQATLVDSYFRSNETKLDGNLREWVEGSIIRVFTFEVTLPNEKSLTKFTFYSSRSKVDCSGSQWVNLPDCPFTKDAFQAAMDFQKISHDDVEKVNRCFAFVLRDPWNQIRSQIETPSLVHFRSYRFDLEYEEIDEVIPNAIIMPPVSLTEASEMVLNGKVVITTNAFNNIKIMLDKTAKEYEWLETTSSNPVMKYCELKACSPQDLNHYESLLFGWAKDKVDEFKLNYPVLIAQTGDYIYRRLIMTLEHPKAAEALDKNHTIDNIIRTVKRAFTVEKQASKSKRFVWGGSKAGTERKQLECITECIHNLETNDGVALARLISSCSRYEKSETVRCKRVASDVTNIVSGANISAPQPKKTDAKTVKRKKKVQNKTKKSATKKVVVPPVEEAKLFVPDQSMYPSDDEASDDTLRSKLSWGDICVEPMPSTLADD